MNAALKNWVCPAEMLNRPNTLNRCCGQRTKSRRARLFEQRPEVRCLKVISTIAAIIIWELGLVPLA
jgi:hypothetical protein